MTTETRVWLTQQAFDRLQQELDVLLGVHPVDDGADHRASRIRQIREILRDAVVGEAPPDDGMAEPGMVLTVRFEDEETATFLLSVREATEPDRLEVYSPDSPLGAALCGAREGERRTYSVPSGAAVGVTLLRAVPYGHHTRSL